MSFGVYLLLRRAFLSFLIILARTRSSSSCLSSPFRSATFRSSSSQYSRGSSSGSMGSGGGEVRAARNTRAGAFVTSAVTLSCCCCCSASLTSGGSFGSVKKKATMSKMTQRDQRRWPRNQPAYVPRDERTSRVVRLRRFQGQLIQNCDVYIGRAVNYGGWSLPESKWANPFLMKNFRNDRELVLKLYRAYVRSKPELMASLPELRGQRLGCWCKPARCHGDVLVELLAGKNCYLTLSSDGVGIFRHDESFGMSGCWLFVVSLLPSGRVLSGNLISMRCGVFIWKAMRSFISEKRGNRLRLPAVFSY